MDKLKGGVKLVTITVKRELQQTDKPSVQELFLTWKTRAKFMRNDQIATSFTAQDDDPEVVVLPQVAAAEHQIVPTPQQ